MVGSAEPLGSSCSLEHQCAGLLSRGAGKVKWVHPYSRNGDPAGVRAPGLTPNCSGSDPMLSKKLSNGGWLLEEISQDERCSLETP